MLISDKSDFHLFSTMDISRDRLLYCCYNVIYPFPFYDAFIQIVEESSHVSGHISVHFYHSE
jgi:hypothetical protein